MSITVLPARTEGNYRNVNQDLWIPEYYPEPPEYEAGFLKISRKFYYTYLKYEF
jgi:hypothetical protein